MTLATYVIIICASVAVTVAYIFGKRDGINAQKQETLDIIESRTKYLTVFNTFVRDDASTVTAIQQNAEYRTSVFDILPSSTETTTEDPIEETV